MSSFSRKAWRPSPKCQLQSTQIQNIFADDWLFWNLPLALLPRALRDHCFFHRLGLKKYLYTYMRASYTYVSTCACWWDSMLSKLHISCATKYLGAYLWECRENTKRSAIGDAFSGQPRKRQGKKMSTRQKGRGLWYCCESNRCTSGQWLLWIFRFCPWTEKTLTSQQRRGCLTLLSNVDDIWE